MLKQKRLVVFLGMVSNDIHEVLDQSFLTPETPRGILTDDQIELNLFEVMKKM